MENSFAWPSFGPAVVDCRSDDIEAVRTRALEEAREEGYAAGLTQAKAETDRLHQALQRSLETLSETAVGLRSDHSQAVVELAMSVVQRLLLVELRTNPAVLQTLVSEALEVLNAQLNEVQVLLNPADFAGVDLRDATSPLAGVLLKEDAGVPLGGVSVNWGQRSVEFDPLGRLNTHQNQGPADGAACSAAD